MMGKHGKICKEINEEVSQLVCEITWKDQGYGNKKARVVIVLKREGVKISNCDLFGFAP
jgi:hypothetical protein